MGARAAEAGLISLSAEEFCDVRVDAELTARRSNRNGEVALDEIYKALGDVLKVEDSILGAIAQIELDTESEMLVSIPGISEILDHARSKCGNLLLVSDMYLSADYIGNELRRLNLLVEGDKLFVSNEWRISKAEGGLYKKILNIEEIDAPTVSHTGDRHDADVSVPSQYGINAMHLNSCALTRYEAMWEQFSRESSGFSSMLAGISRIVRLRSQSTDRDSVLVRISASLIAPILCLYSQWLINESLGQGLKRLYFVARDGYLVKQIFDSLIHSLGIKIDTRYLYGSRQAWHVPAITDFSEQSLSWLFEKTRTLTIRIILSRLQIQPCEISEVLNRIGWPENSWDVPVDDESLPKIKRSFLQDNEFKTEIIKRVEASNRAAVGYLRQEGMYDEVSWAMVDLGWHGRLQSSLKSLLKTVEPVGLYFGLFQQASALQHLKTSSMLNWDLGRPPAGLEIPDLVFLMESFCTAPHGSTVGYEIREDSSFAPMFRNAGANSVKQWGSGVVYRTVEMFAEELSSVKVPRVTLQWNPTAALVKVLGSFSKEPLPDEGRVWGSFPYEDEQGGTVTERLTKSFEINCETIKAAFIYGEEQLIPANWNVLWRGAQPHVDSFNNKVIRFIVGVGLLKKRMGRILRTRFPALQST